MIMAQAGWSEGQNLENLREGDRTGVSMLGPGGPGWWGWKTAPPHGSLRPWLTGPSRTLFFGFLTDKMRLGQNPQIISKMDSASEIL